METATVQYTPAKLKKFKSIINEELKTVRAELDLLQSNQKEQKRRLTNTNIDFNENSKHFQQQANNKRQIRRLQRKFRELGAALKRIAEKTYGICERTGELIREERLMVMPTARFDIHRK